MPLMRSYRRFMMLPSLSWRGHRDLQGSVTAHYLSDSLSPSFLPVGHWAPATRPPCRSLKAAGSLLTQEFAFVLLSPWNALPTASPWLVLFLPSHLHSQIFPGYPIETVHLTTLLATNTHIHTLYSPSFLIFIQPLISLKYSFLFYWFFLLLSVSVRRL